MFGRYGTSHPIKPSTSMLQLNLLVIPLSRTITDQVHVNRKRSNRRAHCQRSAPSPAPLFLRQRHDSGAGALLDLSFIINAGRYSICFSGFEGRAVLVDGRKDGSVGHTLSPSCARIFQPHQGRPPATSEQASWELRSHPPTNSTSSSPPPLRTSLSSIDDH
ncbi:hypothetical protein N431DRAFT_72586 [Stipitochalara longipes BDJ]|nr:hypothetical protein N431DRAFT_72586 [Stipitochalara longipes BDJ]